MNGPDYRSGRRDGLMEAEAWLRDVAGRYVRGGEVERMMRGAADFMQQRSKEVMNDDKWLETCVVQALQEHANTSLSMWVVVKAAIYKAGWRIVKQ
jgi:hypothetical protein